MAVGKIQHRAAAGVPRLAAACLLAFIAGAAIVSIPSVHEGLTLLGIIKAAGSRPRALGGSRSSSSSSSRSGDGPRRLPRVLVRQIRADLKPWRRTGITLLMVEQAYCRSHEDGFRFQVGRRRPTGVTAWRGPQLRGCRREGWGGRRAVPRRWLCRRGILLPVQAAVASLLPLPLPPPSSPLAARPFIPGHQPSTHSPAPPSPHTHTHTLTLRAPQAIDGRLYVAGLTQSFHTRHLAMLRMLFDLHSRTPLPDLDFVVESADM